MDQPEPHSSSHLMDRRILFCVIIGSRYVHATRLYRNLLTRSVDNKRWGLIKLVEVARNALTFMVLSPLRLCHLQSAHTVLSSLMQFSTLPIHPSLCEPLQKKIMTKQKSHVHVLHKKVAHFRKVEQILPQFSQKLNINEQAVRYTKCQLSCL